MIHGLTIHQPWAWAIAAGHKPVENRSWRPARQFIGSYLAIHAGRTEPDDMAIEAVAELAGTRPTFGDMELGAIVAVGKLHSVVTRFDSPWFSGPFGLVLTNVVRIRPVPCRGMQKFWPLDEPTLDKVRRGWADARLLTELERS